MRAAGNQRVPEFYGFQEIFAESNKALHTRVNCSDSATILVRVITLGDGHVAQKHVAEGCT
jgi:hypothetical protein